MSKNILSIVDLFLCFCPHSLILRSNWIRVLRIIGFIPSYYWIFQRKLYLGFKKLLLNIHLEFILTLRPVLTIGVSHIFISLFIFIIFNNRLGLLPYVFTSTAHIRLSLTLALPIFLGIIGYSIIYEPSLFFSHLVPLGSPYPLVPSIVFIELIRLIIRPLTLSIRLVANITTGHLLIVLLRSSLLNLNLILFIRVIIIVIVLFILEIAVSIIQSYVFSLLSNLYVSAENSPNF